MRDPRAADPAEVVVAWEAVEEILSAVPEGPTRAVLRLLAAGLESADIAERLALDQVEVQALAARGRVRILTAALSRERDGA
jgi:DNA-directed RNA polymerase specialized sigma24 family protein